jgi:3-oxoacyl-[acyl-carrier-protein] synthase II
VSRRRVVVTGAGLVSPHGTDPEAAFDELVAGRSAVQRVTTGEGPRAAEVLMARARWEPEAHVGRMERVVMDPVAQMGVVAARHALQRAGLVDEEPDASTPASAGVRDAGVYFGCALGGAASLDDQYRRYLRSSTRRTRPAVVPRVMPNAPAAHISMAFGLQGPSLTYSVACASSAAALGEAFRAIRDDYLSVAVAGGAEALLADPIVAAWQAMGVIASEHPDGPAASARPFDARRSGFVLGEGAAVLVLEDAGHARARGAPILGEIVGYASSSDAHHLTQPSPDGQVAAMRAALGDARLPPDAVGYVNAHATGTEVGDVVEVRALRRALGPHADRVPVSSTKSMHGHLVGAAGALEALVTLQTLRRGVLPPTANLDDPDPACDLDLVPRTARRAPELEVAISNSFGFGGANTCLVLRRTDA